MALNDSRLDEAQQQRYRRTIYIGADNAVTVLFEKRSVKDRRAPLRLFNWSNVTQLEMIFVHDETLEETPVLLTSSLDGMDVVKRFTPNDGYCSFRFGLIPNLVEGVYRLRMRVWQGSADTKPTVLFNEGDEYLSFVLDVRVVAAN